VVLNDNAFSKFNKVKRYLITIPPNPDLRTFNENDVLGDLDRDDKGNVIVEGGRYPHDKNRNPVNSRGYLIDPKSGDIIDSE
jgi:hypothetical protein